MDNTTDTVLALTTGQLIVGIIGVLFAIAALIIAYRSYKRTKQKRLTLTTSEPIPLVNITTDAAESIEIEIRVEGEIINGAELVTYHFANTGNGAIRNPKGFDEYERPIHVQFGDNIKILRSTISDKNPTNLQVGVRVDGQKIVVGPVLLNEGNSFTLNVIASEIGEIIPDWHIEDVVMEVKSIVEISRLSFPKDYLLPIIFIITVFILTSGFFIEPAVYLFRILNSIIP